VGVLAGRIIRIAVGLIANGPHHLYRNNEAQVIHEMDAFYDDVLR
jgi:hypothetical protein